MGKEDIHSRIQDLAETAPVTGAFPQIYESLFKLPENYQGIKILDICGGVSSFSEWVNQNGGIPQAIDFNYAFLGTLIDNYKDTFKNVMDQDPNPNLEDYQKGFEMRLTPFALSLDQHPSIYIAASATHLPFKDNYYDYVVSLNGIFGTLDEDPDILKMALNEAIRVVKKGGTVQLAPTGEYPTLSPQETRNQSRTITELQQNRQIKISYEKRVFKDRMSGVLTLTKKK